MSDSLTQMEKFLSSGAMAYPCGNPANAKEMLQSIETLKTIPVATRLKSLMLQGTITRQNRTTKRQLCNN